MRRLLSIGFVLSICVAAVIFAGAREGGESHNRTYRVELDNAFGLTAGGDFRVGGVKAGKTIDFEPTKATPDRGPKAIVTVEVTEPGFADFRADASCETRPQSVIGEYFVDCQPGKSPRRLKNDGLVPVSQTTSTIPLDLVNDVMREPYKQRLRMVIDELGTGLAGRPADLAAVVRRAHPGLRETSKTLQILARQNRIIENFLRDADTVVSQLERRKVDVARFIDEAGRTAQTTATRRRELEATLRRLPGFLDELDPTMVRLGQLADEQVPLLADAQRAAPSLDQFLTRLGPFSDSARPALDSLGQTSVVGTRAFKRGSNEVRELRTLARATPAASKPARQLLESMDDDRRATDDDRRALVGGPPKGDPSNRNGGKGGFTGFESLFNYFFWQSQSINGFDQVGHILRVGLTVGQCSQYENRTPQKYPDDAALKAKIAACNAYLGPSQPGITTPDFTGAATTASTGGGGRSTLSSDARQPASRVGERRSPGQPDAGPVPGQRDISKPQVTLPPGVKDIVKQLPKERRRKARKLLPQLPIDPDSQLSPNQQIKKLLDGLSPKQGASPQSPLGGAGDLLDYLLAP